MVTPIARHHDEVEQLCRRYRVRRLELFGSAASGQFDPDTSDLDFLVTFEELEPTAALISEHHRIIAFRNILIHGYAQIDDRLVWGVLESKLPTLSQDVKRLLEEETR